MNMEKDKQGQKPVYTFEVRKGCLSNPLKRTERYVLDTGREDVQLLVNTNKWSTDHRSSLPDQQKIFKWDEVYAVGEGDEQRFVQVIMYASSQQPISGLFLEPDAVMDLLETAEPAYLTEMGQQFLNVHDRRKPA